MENNIRTRRRASSRFPDGFRILKGAREYVTYPEDASVRIWYSETPGQFENHYHSAVEIIMPIKGEVNYTVSEFSYMVQADEVLIVPPNWEHSLSMGEGSARYLLLFEPDSIFNLRDMQQIDGMLKIPIYVSGDPEAQATIRALLMQVINCYEKRDFLWNSLCYSMLTQMYVKLGLLNSAHGSPRGNPYLGHTDPEMIDSARQYVDQHYMRDINLDDVSAFVGFTKCYFSRVFKRQIGMGFSDYLRRKRVSMASELLIHSGQSISKIAANAGFGSVATFNRVFREVKNCTPTEYRRIYGTCDR